MNPSKQQPGGAGGPKRQSKGGQEPTKPSSSASQRSPSKTALQVSKVQSGTGVGEHQATLHDSSTMKESAGAAGPTNKSPKQRGHSAESSPTSPSGSSSGAARGTVGGKSRTVSGTKSPASASSRSPRVSESAEGGRTGQKTPERKPSWGSGGGQKGPQRKPSGGAVGATRKETESVGKKATQQEKLKDVKSQPAVQIQPTSDLHSAHSVPQAVEKRSQPKPSESKPSQASDSKTRDSKPVCTSKDSEKSSEELPAKSKADVKKERREKQEAQRAAKAAAQSGGSSPTKSQTGAGGPVKESQPTRSNPSPVGGPAKVPTDPQQRKLMTSSGVIHSKFQPRSEMVGRRSPTGRIIDHFSHLPKTSYVLSAAKLGDGGAIHGAIQKLGFLYAKGVLSGSNSRCLGLLAALKQVILDYEALPNKEVSHDFLERVLNPSVEFINKCRVQSTSMGTAVRHLKTVINDLRLVSEEEFKEKMSKEVDSFYHLRIRSAREQISQLALSYVAADGDVILTYTSSSLILNVLRYAKKSGKNFTVIVLDAQPQCKGKVMVEQLQKAGISCFYGLISAAPFLMTKVTKVFLGAHTILANGNVTARCGTSEVAMVAYAFSRPVYVCCETYKYVDKTRTDSFTFNELNDSTSLAVLGSPLDRAHSRGDSTDAMTVLDLSYDLTLARFITKVLSEVSPMSLLSAPLVLRIKQQLDVE